MWLNRTAIWELQKSTICCLPKTLLWQQHGPVTLAAQSDTVCWMTQFASVWLHEIWMTISRTTVTFGKHFPDLEKLDKSIKDFQGPCGHVTKWTETHDCITSTSHHSPDSLDLNHLKQNRNVNCSITPSKQYTLQDTMTTVFLNLLTTLPKYNTVTIPFQCSTLLHW